MPPDIAREDQTVQVLRVCAHCLHEWYQDVTRKELRKILKNEPIGNCPVMFCGLPT